MYGYECIIPKTRTTGGPQGIKAVRRRVLRRFSARGSLDFENLRARTATLS